MTLFISIDVHNGATAEQVGEAVASKLKNPRAMDTAMLEGSGCVWCGRYISRDRREASPRTKTCRPTCARYQKDRTKRINSRLGNLRRSRTGNAYTGGS